MCRISLPTSNIELKLQRDPMLRSCCISLPTSNIELKLRKLKKYNVKGISLPTSNIELKLENGLHGSVIKYQFTYIQH